MTTTTAPPELVISTPSAGRAGWRLVVWRWVRRSIALVISVGVFIACLRGYSTNNNFPAAWHPDEPTKVNQILFDNRNFNHPQLLLEMTTWLTQRWNTPRTMEDVVRVGRDSSAIFAATAVAALAWVGYAHGGLLGMLLMGTIVGLCPPLVTYAHYMKEDAALAVGVALGVLGMVSVARAGRWWTQLLAVGLLGFGCGIATSGKYVGIVSLASFVLVLASGWRHWTLGMLWPIVFLASFVVTVLGINHRAFTDQQFSRFEQALERESEHGLSGHMGLTMNQPNTYFAQVVWRQTQRPAIVLACFYILLLPLHLRQRRGWDFFILVYSGFWLLVLSYGVIYFPRYALPVIVLVHVLAGLGAWETVRLIGPKFRFKRLLATAGLIAIVAAVQGPRAVGFTRQFAVQNDSRTHLAQWMREHLTRQDQVVADMYTGLGAARVPARVRTQFSASSFGTIADLQRTGVQYVAVSDIFYHRLYIPQVKPERGEEASYARMRAFYDDLFAHYPLVWRSRPTINQEAFTSPELRVYRISRP